MCRSTVGLKLDVGSPSDTSPAAAAPSSSKAVAPGKASRKAKKPAARTRKGANGRPRTATSGKAGHKPSSTTAAADAATMGPSVDPAVSKEGSEKAAPKIIPRRKAPVARKARSVRGVGNTSGLLEISVLGEDDDVVVTSGTERQRQVSPTSHRDRSPARKGAGRPERSADRSSGVRRVSTPVQSPLRPITNYTSEGDRASRGNKGKVGMDY